MPVTPQTETAAMIAVPNYVTPEEYLAIERESKTRHEYRRGLVYAMAGGTDNHDTIGINLLTLINLHLSGSGCRVHSGNVKVSYKDELYYYPDAFVTCDDHDRADRYIKRYPKLVVEVLSASTEVFDRGKKFEDYQLIETLEEYVLVDQTQQRVECRRRLQERWETVVYEGGDRAYLTSIGLEFAVSDLYRGTD